MKIPDAADAPIGVFDSGLGGLSVLREIRRHLPGEPLIYAADSIHAPYGEKPADWVRQRSLEITAWMLEQGVKALVVACNTATAHAIQTLRERFPRLPLIGVEPGIKPAAQQSRSRVVGVLATENTLNSERFHRLLAAHAGDCRFLTQPGYGLVPLIEAGDTDSPAIRELLHGYLQPMLDAGADTLVLGCTHYPFLIPAIRDIARERLELVNTGEAIARQLARILLTHDLTREVGKGAAGLRLYSSHESMHLKKMALKLAEIRAPATTTTMLPKSCDRSTD